MYRLKTLTWFFVLLLHFSLFSRESNRGFLYLDKDMETHQFGTYAIETEDDCFIIASEVDWYWEPGTLRKLSSEGNLLSLITIGETYSRVASLFADPAQNNCYYAIGARKDTSGNMSPFILHFDNNLNIISLVDVEIPESYIYLEPRAIIDYNHEETVIYSSVAFCQNNPNGIGIHLRFTLDGTLQHFAAFPIYMQNSGFLFHFVDGNCWSYKYGELSFYSDSLTLNLVNEYSQIIHEPIEDTIWHNIDLSDCFYPTAVCLPDSSFLIAEEVLETWTNIYQMGLLDYRDQMAFFKSNFEGEVENVIVVGSRDTLERPAPFQAIDFRHQDTLYLCAYQDVEPDSWGDVILGNKIFLKKADRNLNVYWEKSYILGPEHYEPIYMMATKDGGCLITGRIYYNYDMDTVDVFALKINADGTVGTDEIIVEDVRPYTCWPNPAQDQLYLQYSPDIKPTQIELYDLQGRLVRTQRNGLESIGMESLPAGTYTMWVTLEDGKVFSDKVVKE